MTASEVFSAATQPAFYSASHLHVMFCTLRKPPILNDYHSMQCFKGAEVNAKVLKSHQGPVPFTLDLTPNPYRFCALPRRERVSQYFAVFLLK